MIKQGMIRNLSILIVAIILAVSLTALPEIGFSMDPYEVIVYEHANFVGESYPFRLEPGMRQLLFPDLKNLNDRISSIQVGSKVGVMVFSDANFAGMIRILYDSQNVFVPEQREQNPFVAPLPDANESVSLNYLVEHESAPMNDSISSLIVFPKEWTSPLGVMLFDLRKGGGHYRFFPLPDALSETEARYAHMGGMDDDANGVRLYPYAPKSPAYGKVQVTLYENPDFGGKRITLPGGGGDSYITKYAYYKLGDYQFDDTASSLVVRWLGPVATATSATPAAPQESSSVRVVAPEAPSSTRVVARRARMPSDRTPPPPSSGVTMTNISGQWKSSIGLVYNITQQGGQFNWTVASSNEKGEGTIKGDDLSASWTGQQGPGSSAGKITAVDSSGKATEIKWNNGVRFYR